MKRSSFWFIPAIILSILWLSIYTLIGNECLKSLWSLMIIPTLFVVFACGERDARNNWRSDK